MISKKITAAITAVGGYVPEDKLTNFDLEKMVDTNDEWIRTRTGISERRILKGSSGLAKQCIVLEYAQSFCSRIEMFRSDIVTQVTLLIIPETSQVS